MRRIRIYTIWSFGEKEDEFTSFEKAVNACAKEGILGFSLECTEKCSENGAIREKQIWIETFLGGSSERKIKERLQKYMRNGDTK